MPTPAGRRHQTLNALASLGELPSSQIQEIQIQEIQREYTPSTQCTGELGRGRALFFPGHVDYRLEIQNKQCQNFGWHTKKNICFFGRRDQIHPELRTLGGPGLKYLEKLQNLHDPSLKKWIIIVQCSSTLDPLNSQTMGKPLKHRVES